MKKRMLFMLVCAVVFIGVLGGVKSLQIRTAMAEGAYQPPPEAVTSIVAEQKEWDQTLSAIGSVRAVHGVMVSADLPGIVESIEFTSGRRVHEGDVLVRLDTSQEKAQLEAAQARLELAKLDLGRYAKLKDQEIVPEAAYDRAVVEARQAEAAVGEIRATIDRKIIRAPFSGELGIRQVNLGQYLNGGDAIVSLQSLDPIFVDFALPQQDITRVRNGAEVRIRIDGVPDPSPGRVTAVESMVDESTRNIPVQATFANREGRIRPGMFVEVQLVAGAKSNVVAVPASAISYAPYGNSVFVIEEMKGEDGVTYKGVRQQFVKLGPARGDLVAVLSGVSAGDEIVSSGAFKLRSGAAVKVDNSIQPSSNPAPEPEDS